MSIISINVNTTGLVGQTVNPRRCTMITTDNLATITTAGYLNNYSNSGNPILPTDIFEVYYSFNESTQSGTYGTFLVGYSVSTGFTIDLWENPGNVLVPVTSGNFAVFNGTEGQINDLGYIPSDTSKTKVIMAGSAVRVGYIAHFTDINGTIDDTAGTVINDGPVQSGISGIQGGFNAYAPTAANGYFGFYGSDAGGAFNTLITNSTMGQTSIINVPDPGASTGKFLLSGAAVVSGNLPQYSGTTGLTIDSGIAASGLQILSASVSLNQAAVQGMYATPVQIIAAVANKVIIPVRATVYTNFNTTAFAGGGVAILQYDSTANGAGTNSLTATFPDAEITAASSQIYSLGGMVASAMTGITNKGLFFSNQTGAFTGGNAASTIVISVSYYLVTATV